MRIISGSARGRKLFTPASHNRAIRPTSDRAREALFSIIGEQIVNCNVLDLFGGTGAFGCEALSRNAKLVAFVDNAKSALNLIYKNVKLIPDGLERALILRHDLQKGITESLFSGHSDVGFGLIFADPPYRTELSSKIISSLDNNSILSSDPLIIIEEEKSFNPPDKLEKLELSDIRIYGDTSFIFYRCKKPLNFEHFRSKL